MHEKMNERGLDQEKAKDNNIQNILYTYTPQSNPHDGKQANYARAKERLPIKGRPGQEHASWLHRHLSLTLLWLIFHRSRRRRNDAVSGRVSKLKTGGETRDHHEQRRVCCDARIHFNKKNKKRG